MLYDCWRETARRFSNEIALRDLSGKQQWTFAELASATDVKDEASRVFFPQGNGAEFVFGILRAWRNNQVVCPLEAGQGAPTFDAVPSGCVHLKLTSGSTGAPRAVAFRAEQLLADADNIVTTMGLRREWPNLAVISLAHSYGFSNLILPLLLHGIPLILGSSPLPEPVRRACEEIDALTLPAVPALWRTWSEANVLSSRIRLAISAGAPLPLALEREIYSRCEIKVHNFYGSSECGGIAFDRTATPRDDPSLAGTAICNVSLSVDNGGRLEVRGKAVGETYWPHPNVTLCDGVFTTSDLAELRDGNVYLRGRASDQINVAGRKISPEVIERILLLHPKVADCLIFGTSSEDTDRTDEITACVVPRVSVDGETLKQFLLTQLPAWQVPRQWWFVDSLSVNERGKLSRAEWRRKFLERGK